MEKEARIEFKKKSRGHLRKNRRSQEVIYGKSKASRGHLWRIEDLKRSSMEEKQRTSQESEARYGFWVPKIAESLPKKTEDLKSL